MRGDGWANVQVFLERHRRCLRPKLSSCSSVVQVKKLFNMPDHNLKRERKTRSRNRISHVTLSHDPLRDIPLLYRPAFLPQNLLSETVRIAMESLDIDFRRFYAEGYNDFNHERKSSNIGYPVLTLVQVFILYKCSSRSRLVLSL